MASPGVIGAIGIGSTLIGGLMQGEGKKQQEQAQSEMYAYQARIAQINSSIDKQNADFAINNGEQQSVIEGLKGGQRLSMIRAAEGASGFDVNTGSAVEVQNSQRKISGMDLDQIRSNASKVAYDYTTKSVMDINQAGLDTMASSNASKAGDMELASSLVSTAGSVSSKWLQASQSGLFNSVSA